MDSCRLCHRAPSIYDAAPMCGICRDCLRVAKSRAQQSWWGRLARWCNTLRLLLNAPLLRLHEWLRDRGLRRALKQLAAPPSVDGPRDSC